MAYKCIVKPENELIKEESFKLLFYINFYIKVNILK